ncbi:MAG: IS3 family transposase [Nocardioidaceae bacterium]
MTTTSSTSAETAGGTAAHDAAAHDAAVPDAAADDGFAAAQYDACDRLAPLVGRSAACQAAGLPRSSWYRAHRQSPPPDKPAPVPHVERRQPRALSTVEREHVRGVLNSDEFVDQAPATVWARLLDAGVYHCSVSTMYRILREAGQVRERRRQATHPPRVKPELVAHCPNRVWSWDITKLAGPARGIWYHAYVIIDIYSRYVLGWMIADREDQELARRLIAETIDKHDIAAGALTLHSDRGAAMKSKTVAELLADLQVTKSHSRPKTSNDNPYSESQFKTFKYRPGFPDRFASVEHAREFGETFFDWYNHDHRHSGIGLHTPYDVHHGLAEHVRNYRADVLDQAHTDRPERFVHGRPQPPRLPEAAWINRPATTEKTPANPNH